MNNRKKKVLFLDHGSALGGGQIVLLSLLKGIDKNAFDCWLVCPEEGELTRRAREIPGVSTKVIEVNPDILQIRRKASLRQLLIGASKVPSLIFKLMRFIREERFDLIYTNSTKAHLYGSLVGLFTRVPVVWREHDTLTREFFDMKILLLTVIMAILIPQKIMCVSD